MSSNRDEGLHVEIDTAATTIGVSLPTEVGPTLPI